ncbi:hypothetical protein HDU76_003824 [Blyttiomyces sp. JEL0837]|nr:hypothetical protein HDU76_003824 [Blyttiomyces sp. JEL0837]
MLAVFSIWLFCVFPLSLIGVILGRNWGGTPNFPCRVNPIPRPVPDRAWYAEPFVIILLGGLLPFGSIFIEISKMFGIFQSAWYFGYTGISCFAIFLILGFVGHVAAELFIGAIYRNLRID